jgi:chemotaxis protein CheC
MKYGTTARSASSSRISGRSSKAWRADLHAGAGKALMSILCERPTATRWSPTVADPGEETLMEVGNILVGACIGKIAGLLGDTVAYSPPRVLVGNLARGNTAKSKKMFDPGTWSSSSRRFSTSGSRT